MLPEADQPVNSQNTPGPQAQSNKGWAEEERRREKVELQGLQSAMGQVLSRYREAVGRLEVAEAELRQVRAQVGRLAHNEDGLREVREVLAGLRDWQEEHARDSTRSTQAQSLASERDQRSLGEMETRLADLTREAEALKGRVSMLSEEIRRDQGSLPPVQREVDLLTKRIQTLTGRLDLVDETLRHRDARSLEAAQQVERLAAEQGRFTDWQRLAEVRWGRQLADWQGQMEEWRGQSEDGVREVQGVAKSVPLMKDELVELRRMLVEDRERATERSAAMAEMAAQRGVDRETLGQAEQRIASLAGRLDQMTAQVHLIVDKIDRLFDGQQVLEGRLRAERERVEGVLIALARQDERATALDRRLEETGKDLAAMGRAQGARADELERSLADLARRTDLRVGELERLEEAHKQREIAELEQQIREMQERAKQAKS